MARPRLPLGALGNISVTEYSKGSGRYRALAHYRRSNGTLGQIERTSKSAIKARMEVQAAFEKNGENNAAISPDMRMSRLADLFIEEKTQRRAPGTVQTYQNAIDAHIKPGLGERIEKPGKPGSKPIPPEKLGKFLHAIEHDERMIRSGYADVFRLMAGTGMRMGEQLGVTWDAIDFDKSMIHVVQQAKYLDGQGAVLQRFTKTHASRRSITVPKFVMDAGSLIYRASWAWCSSTRTAAWLTRTTSNAP